jgi:NADPH2:quinone reductase
VKACGVNFADSLMIAGRYQDPPPLPFTPGFEIAGEVIEVGGQVTGFKPGQRVITLNRFGGFAEEAVSPASGLVAMPEGLDFETAAALPVAYGTAHLALKTRGRLKPGETLVVHGAGGGAGLAAVELGRLMGATVIASAGTPEKLEAAERLGAHYLVHYTQEDLITRLKEITRGRGVDVAYDPVGGEAFAASLKTIAFEGRIMLIGFAGGDIPQIPANHLLVKNAGVIGVFWGAYKHKRREEVKAALAELMELAAQGQISPRVSHRFPLAETPKAINTLLGRASIGKVVVTIPA